MMENTNESKLEEMKYDILRIEDENAKTKQKNQSDMVEEIRQIVINGAKEKNY